MSAKLDAARKRSTNQRIPFSIPLDDFPLNLDWLAVLAALRHKKKKRAKPDTLAVAIEPLPGTAGARDTIQLRRVVASIRLSGISGPAQKRLYQGTNQLRTFFNTAKEKDLAKWWKSLHTSLPRPLFFFLYSTLRACA